MPEGLLFTNLHIMFALQVGFLEITWVDLLDITLVAALLFYLLKLMRESIALKVFIGFLAIYLLYLVVKATEMELLTAILGQFIGVGVIAAIILFQQEIRKFLLIIGKTAEFRERTLFNFFRPERQSKLFDEMHISPIIEALKSFSATSTGALIVISKTDNLKNIAETGDLLDAQISKRLLQTIFYKNSPLHDGAVIIHKNRIQAARCVLPISDSPDLPATLGMRHRAAMGISEQSDAVVLIVSEQTGAISMVQHAQLHYNLPAHEVRRLLYYYLVNATQRPGVQDPSPAPVVEPDLRHEI